MRGNFLGLGLVALTGSATVAVGQGVATTQPNSIQVALDQVKTGGGADDAASRGPFFVPAYDVRLALDLDFIQNRLADLSVLSYEDEVRLGEFGCADSHIQLDVLQSPELRVGGGFDPLTAQYQTTFLLLAAAQGKLGTACWGAEEVVARALFHATLGRISAAKQVDLSADASLEVRGGLATFVTLFGIPFSLRESVPLPIQALSSFPVRLRPPQVTEPGDALTLDFGHWCGDVWMTEGDVRTIPVSLNVGSILSTGNKGDRYLVLDATFGSLDKRPAFSEEAARHEFEADLPIWPAIGMDVPRNFGASVRESTFSPASPCHSLSNNFDPPAPCATPKGLLGHLLPIRLRGSRQVKKGLALEYSLVLDGAGAKFTNTQGVPTIEVDLSAGYAALRTIKTKGADVQVGKPFGPKGVQAHIRFDRLRLDDGDLHFRVAEFKAVITVGKNGLPFVLSAGGLEQALNGGVVSLGTSPREVDVAVPECLPVGEKFKGFPYKCQQVGKPVGVLSRTAPSWPGWTLSVSPDSFDLRTSPFLQLTGGFKSGRRPDIDPSALADLRGGKAVFVTEWRSTDLTPLGEKQCGTWGGTQYTRFGEWTPPIRMDTDQRPGGCSLRLGLLDPKGLLKDFVLRLNWTATGAAGQCKGTPGSRVVPVSTDIPKNEGVLKLSDPIVVDTDDDGGGCLEQFLISGRDDLVLDVKFFGDDDASQCGQPPDPNADGSWTVSSTKAQSFLIDTDHRWGGCVQQLRLRRAF